MGGALADPCRSYPSVFRRGTIFDRFPYLLPNLICTIILAVGVTIGILFLEETHEDRRYKRDIGLETGRWILRRCRRRPRPTEAFTKAGDANLYETRSLLEEDEQPPDYHSTEGSPRPSSSRVPYDDSSDRPDFKSPNAPRKRPSCTDALTKQVVLNIVAYGILA